MPSASYHTDSHGVSQNRYYHKKMRKTVESIIRWINRYGLVIRDTPRTSVWATTSTRQLFASFHTDGHGVSLIDSIKKKRKTVESIISWINKYGLVIRDTPRTSVWATTSTRQLISSYYLAKHKLFMEREHWQILSCVGKLDKPDWEKNWQTS